MVQNNLKPGRLIHKVFSNMSNNDSMIVSKKKFMSMSRASTGITGNLIDMRSRLEALDNSIKADEKSKAEFEVHLTTLYKKRDDLRKLIEENVKWTQRYETDLGPFTKKYKAITEDISGLYANAKKGHAKGITLLEKEFNYHPAFKRPGDTFHAIPFKPK